MKRIILLVSVAILLTACSFHPIAQAHIKKAKSDFPLDVVIVPGFPYQPEKSNMVLKMRMLWAKKLFDQGLTKNILVSGGAVTSPYNEAKIMKQMGIAMGIPAQFIIEEQLAEHSKENVYHGVRLAKSMGFKKIGLATDPVQYLMLKSYLKTHFSHVKPLAIMFDEIKEDLPKKLAEINYEECRDPYFIHLKEKRTKTEIRYRSAGLHLDHSFNEDSLNNISFEGKSISQP